MVPGATVTTTNRNSGFVRSTVSDAEGRYRLAALTPGSYEVVAELQGFSRALRQGLTFSLGSETVLNFTLQLGSLSEAVTVTAETPVVQTTTAAVETKLDRATIDVRPIQPVEHRRRRQQRRHLRLLAAGPRA